VAALTLPDLSLLSFKLEVDYYEVSKKSDYEKEESCFGERIPLSNIVLNMCANHDG
jgi:hypothetical protein